MAKRKDGNSIVFCVMFLAGKWDLGSHVDIYLTRLLVVMVLCARTKAFGMIGDLVMLLDCIGKKIYIDIYSI